MAEKIEKKPVIKEAQLNSINRVLSTLAFGLVTIIGLQYIAKDILAPFLFAIFLTVILFPLFRWFRKKGFSSKVSLTLMILTFFLGAGLIIVFLTWSFTLLAQSLSSYVDGFKQAVGQTAESVSIDSQTAQNVVASVSPETVQYVIGALANSFGNIFLYFFLVPVLSILMVLQIDSIPKDLEKRLAIQNTNIEKFKKFAESIIIYVTSRLKVNLVTGILFSIALIILGVPFPFVWGFLTLIMSFIPYIGIIIASTPPVLLAFAEYGMTGALLVIGAMAIINIFAENVLSPSIQGRENKISTATVVISLLFWTWLLGPIGVILAVPLTVFLKLIFAGFQETYFLSLLMEGNYDIKTAGNGSVFYKKYLNKFVSFVPRKKSK